MAHVTFLPGEPKRPPHYLVFFFAVNNKCDDFVWARPDKVLLDIYGNKVK